MNSATPRFPRSPDRRAGRRPRFTVLNGALLAALLAYPVWALVRLTWGLDPRWVAGGAVTLWGLTFFFYWRDKRSAEAGTWRTPEATLHLLELLGGWPAAFLAQRLLRHKIAKTRYQVTFWAIVCGYQLVAFDYLCGWHHSRTLLALVPR